MDPMARTYLEPDDEVYRLWTSGLPVMEILEAEARRTRRLMPANDGEPDWSAIRDHTSGSLDAWLDRGDPDPRDVVPLRPRLVYSREG